MLPQMHTCNLVPLFPAPPEFLLAHPPTPDLTLTHIS
jgi:hypothetical protein